jgi:hypothetical protein
VQAWARVTSSAPLRWPHPRSPLRRAGVYGRGHGRHPAWFRPTAQSFQWLMPTREAVPRCCMLHGVATPIATLLRAQVATIAIVAALCEAALDPTGAMVRRVAAMLLVRDPARTAARESPQASAAARPRLVVPEQRVGSAAHRVQDRLWPARPVPAAQEGPSCGLSRASPRAL